VATAAATDIPEYYANTNGNGYPTDTDRRGFDTMSFDFTVRSCAVSPPPTLPCRVCPLATLAVYCEALAATALR
jgi:hypothetical protein